MTQQQKSIAQGVSILGLAGIICKLVGVLYRIPLANLIGGDGIGVYQQVFSSYNLLLTISSAGIPVAISRMVSFHLTRNDPRNAGRVFRASLWMLIALGAVATLLLVLCAGAIGSAVGTPETRDAFIMIAPSIFLVCVMSAYRGVLQGRRKMQPTAISQLIEQVGKVGIALPFAAFGMQYGSEGARYAYGAAGAMLGTSVAELAALIFMMICYAREKRHARAQDESIRPLAYKGLCRHIAAVAVPITLGACIVPLAGWIDSVMLVRLMEPIVPPGEALVRYGVYSALVISLINVPTALAMAMSTNLVPAISEGLARRDRAYIARESENGLRMAMVVGLPCSLGMHLLAKPLLMMLYLGKYTEAQLTMGAELLQVSAMTIVLFTMVQATSGILQGLRRQVIPMLTLAAGVVCKVALNYALIRVPDINIHGAPYASLLCYTVSMLPNLYFVYKNTGCKLDVKDLLLRPGLATLMMCAVVLGLKALFGEYALNHSTIKLMITVTAGILTYFAAAVLLDAIKPEDMPARLRKLLVKKAK